MTAIFGLGLVVLAGGKDGLGNYANTATILNPPYSNHISGDHMFIIWQGAGIAAALIPAILGFVAQWAVDRYFGHGYAVAHGWQNAIAWSVGAVIVWIVGTRLEKRPGKLLVDPATGNNVELKQKHTLFWIPMKYWAVVWVMASIVSLTKGYRLN